MATAGAQISKGLRATRHIYTTNDPVSQKAVTLKSRPGHWTPLDGNKMAFDVVYTTSEFPASLNDEEDVKAHETLASSGKLGLVNPGGTVCRQVDFAPGSITFMHRTKSLDYGVVIEGCIVLGLDSGEEQILHAGDMVIQRGTNHTWRNASGTQWARMSFVLQDCQRIKAGDKIMEEYHDRHIEGLPLSETANQNMSLKQ